MYRHTRFNCIRLFDVFEQKKISVLTSVFRFQSDSSAQQEPNIQKSGFAKAFEKFSDPTIFKKEDKTSFANLLKNSKFINMGDPEGKVVIGKIFHIVNDDLYIDFGWKFHCVCPRPNKNGRDYVRGAKVKLRLKELELSTRFLGFDKDMTVLEADATLLSVLSTPTSSSKKPPESSDSKQTV